MAATFFNGSVLPARVGNPASRQGASSIIDHDHENRKHAGGPGGCAITNGILFRADIHNSRGEKGIRRELQLREANCWSRCW
jgi:hypothetical protein